MSAQHTLTPWGTSKFGTIVSSLENGRLITVCSYRYGSEEESEANARHIVKCVNSHEALLKACTLALHKLGEAKDKLHKAIKQATPEVSDLA